jgi:hypothetical protein
MSTARRITLSLGALVLLVGATLLPITLANAAPEKIFSVNVAPGSLVAGTQGATLTATFKNETPSGNSTINSARLAATAPAGFTIVTATGAGTEVISSNGQSVSINGIPPVKPNKTYTLTMTVNVPAATTCAGDTVAWSANAWTGNSSNGDTFRFLPSLSNTTTSLSITCNLSFTTQPSDALKNTAVSPAIVVTGSPASLFSGQNVLLAVAGDSPTSGTPAGATSVPADSNGVATFSDIAFTQSGDYKVEATSGGYSTGSSNTFTISDGILDCGNSTPNVDGVTVTRLENANPNETCQLIPYILTRDGNSVTFLKDLTQQTSAQFIVEIDAWDPEPAQNPVPATQTDTPSPDHDLLWCGGTVANPTLPGSEVTCLVKQSTEIVGGGDMQVTETIYLKGDILYKR